MFQIPQGETTWTSDMQGDGEDQNKEALQDVANSARYLW